MAFLSLLLLFVHVSISIQCFIKGGGEPRHYSDEQCLARLRMYAEDKVSVEIHIHQSNIPLIAQSLGLATQHSMKVDASLHTVPLLHTLMNRMATEATVGIEVGGRIGFAAALLQCGWSMLDNTNSADFVEDAFKCILDEGARGSLVGSAAGAVAGALWSTRAVLFAEQTGDYILLSIQHPPCR
eukprot:NODE_5300_length_673_cov_19.827839_g5137_i0.p2 GENE.NODE_5300_length_673_cov_19.827839_g5137_i0~~NODE_5300_length_673_cov_19.827839_g5137_i0.p2  ORF type:complete len:201 (+),score=58.46 NODE_5300_length_673_cov_19.827839_g5137_i0:52-603(+)